MKPFIYLYNIFEVFSFETSCKFGGHAPSGGGERSLSNIDLWPVRPVPLIHTLEYLVVGVYRDGECRERRCLHAPGAGPAAGHPPHGRPGGPRRS